MKFLRNMKIKKKLIYSFSIIAVITVIVGIAGITGNLLLNKNEGKLYKEGIESLTGVNGMYAVIVEQQLELRDMIINIDDQGMVNSYINNLRLREDEFNELYNIYYSSSSGKDQKENQLLKTAMDIYNGQYKTLKEQMITAFESDNHEAVWEAYIQISDVSGDATKALYEMVLYGNERAEAIKAGDSKTAYILITLTLVLTVLSAVLAVLFGIYIAKIIAVPVSNMSKAARTLSTGDVDVNILVDSHDEISDLADAFKNMIKGIHEQAVVLNAIESGDYTVSIPIRSEKDVINNAINNLAHNGSQMMNELRASSSQVSAASEQISIGAQGLAEGSTDQASGIEELSSAIAEVNEQVDENYSRSNQTLVNCDTTSKLMKESMQSMEKMLDAMAAIDESSRNIANVIKVIDDIAFQTNLLALNAAIEAARAGQYGKGFAVVADEVRDLASKSAAAAKETAALIEGSTKRVKEGSKIVEMTNDFLMSASIAASENAEIINEITKSLETQTKAIKEINQGIEQVSSVVQTNAATAQESAAAAEEMSSQAAMLNDIILRFKVNHNIPPIPFLCENN